MAEYLAPGVFVEEVDRKAPAIESVSTSTTGVVGAAERGPTEGLPQLVTNPFQFRQIFGGPLAGSDLYYGMEGFFANGGRRLYVARAAGAGATQAQAATKGGFITRLVAGADALVGQKVIKPASLRGIVDGTTLQLQMIVNGVTYSSSNLTVAANGVDRDNGTVTLTANIDITPAGPTSYSAKSTAVLTTIDDLKADSTPATGARNLSLVLKAKDKGAWGSDIVLQASPRSSARGEYDSVLVSQANANQIKLKSAAGFYEKAWIEIDRGSATKLYRQATKVVGNVVTLDGPALVDNDLKALAAGGKSIFSTCEFSLSASYDVATEHFDGLTLENVPGRYAPDVVKGSKLITIVTPFPPPAKTNPFYFPCGDDGLNLVFDTAGVDAAPTPADLIGVDGGPGKRSGLKALEDIDDISIIAIPGANDASVQGAMIEQCERLKYRFAILDPGPNLGIADIQAQRKQFDSKYAAIYYPRVIIRDADNNSRALAPSGHMAGLYARIDNSRGVHKAPGNEVIRHITDLEALVSKGEHEILNPMPNNINVLRDFRNDGRGLRVYGARCITSVDDWKYIPVRRLFIFIERSLDLGTQWAVLEPNDQTLWAKITDSVSLFLTRVWLDGGLLGTSKEEAFYVKVGRTTMTQDDIDNGRLIMEIGIAPVKPAEFVIIRIGQWAGGTFVEEG
jgi:Bacteriophage tail sheath protein